MKKLFIVTLAAAVLVMVGITLNGCSNQRVKTPSKCDPATSEAPNPKIVELKAWSMKNYQVEIKTDMMLLCEIANERDIHLEATGDLLMMIDSGAIRAADRSGYLPKFKARLIFVTLRDTFLAAAKGDVFISSGDIYEMAAMYAGDYPELGIVLQYTSLLNLPEYKGRFPTSLDLMDLVQWCDKVINIIDRIK